MDNEARHSSPDQREKINPGEIFIVGEPIFEPSVVSEYYLQIPKGDLHWARIVAQTDTSATEEANRLREEYWDIVQTLKMNHIPFVFMVSHQDLVDREMISAMYQCLGVRGAGFYKEIPPEISCFPRDMLLDLDGTIMINPKANLLPLKNSVVTSLLGEGGSVLKLGNKIFLPSPLGYVESRAEYQKDIRQLPPIYRVGFLPWCVGIETDIHGIPREEFPNNHLDRVAAFIRGKDGKDYLLVDKNYFRESKPPWGSYAREVATVCAELEVTLIIVSKKPEDAPYSLNLVQFADNSVFMTNGHSALRRQVSEIVGADHVFTTNKPVIYFPVLRRGGIRCLTLNVPVRIFRSRH